MEADYTGQGMAIRLQGVTGRWIHALDLFESWEESAGVGENIINTMC